MIDVQYCEQQQAFWRHRLYLTVCSLSACPRHGGRHRASWSTHLFGSNSLSCIQNFSSFKRLLLTGAFFTAWCSLGAASSLHAGVCPWAVTVKSIWDTKPIMMRGDAEVRQVSLLPFLTLKVFGQLQLSRICMSIWAKWLTCYYLFGLLESQGLSDPHPSCCFSFFSYFSLAPNSSWYALLEGIHCVVCAHMKAVVCL